jgi:hypothetical protein
VESRGGRGVITGPRARGYNDKGFNKHYHIGTAGNFGGGGSGDLTNPLPGLPVAAWAKHLSGMAGGYGKLISGLPKHLIGKIGGWVAKKIRDAIGIIGDALGGGAGTKIPQSAAAWAPTVRQQLINLHHTTADTDAVLHRLQQESSGNPKAINRTDSNWRAGHPSVGLMQVIRGTYAKYRPHPDFGPREFGVSENPGSNIYAGLNYAMHDPKYRGRSLRSVMLQKGGYDSGGVAKGRGVMVKDTIAPERVLDPRQTVAFEKLVDSLTGDGSRMELTITNWDSGKGYLRKLAADEVSSAREFSNTQRRMR